MVWKPNIHLFQKHARIYLKVEAVVRRPLHTMTESDALSEGMTVFDQYWVLHHFPEYAQRYRQWENRKLAMNAKPPIGPPFLSRFAVLWDKLNGHKAGAAWDDNPEVYAIRFTVLTTDGPPAYLLGYKPKPILFSTDMVEAILQNKKDTTRRLTNKLQYRKGDVLWVRETWRPDGAGVAFKAQSPIKTSI